MAVVKSADRVVKILEAIASRDGGLTHGELSKMLGIPKGSLSFLLSNLVDRDYLAFDPLGKLYMLGSELLVLTSRYLNSLDIVRTGRPIVHGLALEMNEDAEIAVQRGDQVVFLYKEESSRPVKYSIAPGEVAPLFATSAGKCILAFMPEEYFAAYLDRVTLSPITENSITDCGVLRRELELIRSTGLAYGREEYQYGICGIAAPVFNIHGVLVGSIVATMQAARFNPEHRAFIEPKLFKAASRLSRQLGFVGGTCSVGRSISSLKGAAMQKEGITQ
jgi:DNA-binding IclR family transcriptional regulator